MKKRTSIKRKLVNLFLIMGFFPALLVMLIMYWGVSSHLEEQTGLNQKILAVETSLRVRMFLENKIESVKKYSSYSTLKRIYFPGHSGDMTSQFIRSLFRFDPDLFNIALFDLKKKTLFSYRPNIHAVSEIDLWWERAKFLKKGECLIFYSEGINEQQKDGFIEIVVPLLSDLNQKKLGIMTASFTMSSLVRIIENIPISGNYYISLINEEGFIIADTKETGGSTIKKSMTDLFLADENGWSIGFDDHYKGDAVVGFSSVPGFKDLSMDRHDLKVFVSRAKDDAFKKVFSLLLKLIALCLGVVLIILAFFLLKIESIWKPILSLKKGAEMIGDGNFGLRLFVSTNDELEDLASSFNKMGKKLKVSLDTLEDQNRKLIELNNVKNNFLSMVSHELRTPLMIIKEALSQIIEGIKGPVHEDQKDFLNMAYRNVGRLNQIISDLLSISKIETGKIKLERKMLDLSALVKSEMENQKIKSDEKNITMLMNFSTEKLDLYCDEKKLQIILTNLLGNAIKFTPNNGSISVDLNIKDDFIEIKVKDSGPGIPVNSLDKIFERFVRLNATPLVGAPSTGLGLAIAKELVQMHGGRIWAESDGEKGSVFTFTLPVFKGLDYVNVCFDDRVSESLERDLDLTVFNIHVTKLFAGSDVSLESKYKKAYDDLTHLNLKSLFEPVEFISLADRGEILVFSFLDSRSAEVISGKITDLAEKVISDSGLENILNITVYAATLGINGKNRQELFTYLDSLKTNDNI